MHHCIFFGCDRSLWDALWEVGACHKTIVGVDQAVAQFATNVREARRRSGQTQEDVSAGSGIHPTEVSRIENGERDARVSTVFRLASALGVTPGQLLDGLADSG